MKKSIKYIVMSSAVLVLTVIAVVGMGGKAEAAKAPLCVLDPLSWNQYHKSFDIKGDKVTAKFTLRGEANCRYDMTLATFETPAADAKPFKDQKLFSYKSGTFGRGTHTLTTTMPDCYYQVDILTGKPSEGKKGTRLNDFINRANFTNLGGYNLGNNVGVVHDALIGGNKPCGEKPQPKPQPKDVCPNIAGNQAEVPEGHEKDSEGNCVVPKQPETPKKPEQPKTPEVKSEQTPTVLPQTGAGAVAATFMGISTSAGIAHAIVRRFKK